ncbi:HAD family hydrolase [Oceanobacillus bengalensis]|uniref:Phosphoserine phosphatase n=1 Tax=Oceanobacillus bengalensis TaxID=1435466 RepID=A0A494Z273_9BACI|nr:HAD family hydrolase [Oceanobacillus bengalensis]RKQ16592.1 HAD family hydrolase [Oceanobacillus bengalensis]
MIKAIIFDLDDTLLWDKKSVKLAFEGTCRLAEERFGINPEVLEEKVRMFAREIYESYDTYRFTQMIGINPFEGLWGDFNDQGEEFPRLKEIAPGYRKEAWTSGLKEMGINDSVFGEELAETFPTERKKNPILYEDSLKVLDALKGDYKLLLLTNGSPELQTIKLEITPELRPYFHEIVISGDYGRGKPDQGIFEHALELLSVNREEVLMVGDNLNTDILGANRTGIKSVWVNREGVPSAGDIVPTYEVAELWEVLGLLGK